MHRYAHAHTHTWEHAQKHIRHSRPPRVCVGGWGGAKGRWRETNISLERDWCDLFSTSLFEDDLSEQPVLSRPVCVCVCVSQQQTTSIKERNCSIILATATNQLLHLCPPQLLERAWTKSAGSHGTGCLLVHCISPAEWLDPFTSTDKGMKGNKMCILYSLIHLSCPFHAIHPNLSQEGNSSGDTLALTNALSDVRAKYVWKTLAQSVIWSVYLECCHYVIITHILYLIRSDRSPKHWFENIIPAAAQSGWSSGAKICPEQFVEWNAVLKWTTLN